MLGGFCRFLWERVMSCVVVLLLCCLPSQAAVEGAVAPESAKAGAAWPSWRGPSADGVAVGSPVTQWSVANDVNHAWTASLPGRGASTPVVFEVAGQQRIAVTGSIEEGGRQRNAVFCFDGDGERLWSRSLGPLEVGKHKKASGANPSLAVGDGHVFAYFKSGELAALTFGGDVAWTKAMADEFGGYDSESLWWDLGTSPVVAGEVVVLAVMQSGPSFLAAFDQQTGEVAWKTDRQTGAPKEAAQSYTTPTPARWGGRDVLITLGADAITAHAADDGAELWAIGGLNPTQHEYFRSISSPVVLEGRDGADYLIAPYSRGESLHGLKLESETGAKPPTELTWTRDDLGSDVPTPTGTGGLAFVLGDKGRTKGQLVAIDVATGEDRGSLPLPRSKDGYSASPVLAGSHLYLLREDGAGFVVDVADPVEMTIIGEGRVSERGQGDPLVATPVVVGKRLFIRTASALHCFE